MITAALVVVASFISILVSGDFLTNRTQAAAAEGANSQTLALGVPDTPIHTYGATGGAQIGVIGEAAVVAPHSPQSGESVDMGAMSRSKQTSIYVVRDGDTLEDVAGLFDVSENTIRWANDIDENDSLSTGDTLIILPVSGVRHEVQEGDTLADIAETYDGNLSQIRAFNEITDADLSIGAIIDVPGGEMPASSNNSGAVQRSLQNPRTLADQSGQASSESFIHPVPGSIISQRLHGYNAVDMAGASGSRVLAAKSGEVVKSVGSGWNGGYGKFVVVDHGDGTQTLYSHMSGLIVSYGQRVVQGQMLGYLGNTGRSTGPHVHFEVRGASNPFTSCALRSACGS